MSQTEYSRLLLKRATFPGITPTIPTGSTISNTWLPTDLLEGELYLNSADDRLFVRTANGIKEISISGISSANDYTTSAYLSGSTVFFNRTDLANAYSVDLSALPVTASTGTDYYVTGGTYGAGTLTLDRQNGSVTITGFTSDIYTTGFTYNNANTLTISDNSGNDYSATINTMTGLTVDGNLFTETLEFDTTYTGTTGVGQVTWNTDFGVPQVGMVGGNVVGKINESVFAYVKNVDTTTLNKGEVVYIFGASGDKMSVKRASASGDTTSSKTLGVVAESIGVNQLGYILTQGTLDGLNLGSYTAGDILWLSTTPGEFTNVKQYAPVHLVFIGVVQRANPGNGQIYVKPQNGYELDELHNVAATGATNGDLLVYSASTDLWVSTKTLTGAYTINGSISATTYQNLPIDPDNYVTGGTFSSNTLTLNRQNGSVTITGFTDTIFTGGTGSCITDLYVSNIIGCSPLTIYSDTSITGFTTVGSYTAKDVNSGGDRLKRTITKSSTGEISESDQQLDRLKFDVDANNGNLYTSTQKIDYIEFNTYNDTSKDQGIIKYEDGVGIEISETKVDTGEFYKLSIDKVENVLEHNNNAGRSSRLEQDFTTQQLITVSGSSQSSVLTSSQNVNLDSTDGTNDSYIDILPSSVVTQVTDGGSNTSNIQTYPTNTIITSDDGTQNSYLDTQYNSIQGVTTDTASGNFGNLTVSPTQLQLTSLEGTFNNKSVIDVTPVQTTASAYDDSLAANVTSITLLNSSTDGSAIITAIGNTSNLFQDTLSLDPLNGSYLKSQSTIGADYSELTLSPSNLKTESTYGSNQVITTYDATNTLLVSTTSTGSISSSLILDPTENYDTTGIQTTDGTNTNWLLVRPNDIYLESSDGVDSRTIQITPTTITVTNGVVEYAADYSSQYTDRSIIDKGYVDSVVSTGATAGSFGITIDGGGSAITTGVKGYITIPYNGTITGWDIFADTTGSIVVDVWKDTYANFPPLVADSIAGSEKPTLSSAVKNQDLTLSTWTTSVTAGDIVAFNVDSATSVTRVNLIIYITKQ
jgi:hypothetical protein